MVTKTNRARSGRRRAQANRYIVIGAKGKTETITARNKQEATAKAKRLFPKTQLIQVTRQSSSGHEYESFYITR